MTHDPLCPRQPYEQTITSVIYFKGTKPDLSKIGEKVTMWTADEDACCCDIIAKVREDEKGLSDEDIFNDGQRDMLAKCIAAVKERVWYTPEISTIHAKSYEYGFSDCKERIVAALCALQERP